MFEDPQRKLIWMEEQSKKQMIKKENIVIFN